MGTMGLPMMHHTTWDNLVSWVGTHVEQLAEWSCDQVRANIYCEAWRQRPVDCQR